MTELPSGTITFLFTDIEGSTELWELHPNAMGAALDRHDSLLRRAIEAHRGCVFKTVGDGFYAAFTELRDALAAAIEAQLAISHWGLRIADCGMKEWFGESRRFDSHSVTLSHDRQRVVRNPDSIRVRMAVHVGEAQQRGEDYFGPALNRVARLLETGHGGQTLLSWAAYQRVRDALPDEVSLRDLGELPLRGLERPERVFQLVHRELPAEFPPLKSAGWLSRPRLHPLTEVGI